MRTQDVLLEEKRMERDRVASNVRSTEMKIRVCARCVLESFTLNHLLYCTHTLTLTHPLTLSPSNCCDVQNVMSRTRKLNEDSVPVYNKWVCFVLRLQQYVVAHQMLALSYVATATSHLVFSQDNTANDDSWDWNVDCCRREYAVSVCAHSKAKLPRAAHVG